MATHSNEKTFLADGEVHMEKSITKKIGDNYVKVTAGATLPLELASTSDKELRDIVRKSIKRSYIRLSNIIDEELDEQLENFE
jgi:hypothetical protein